MLADYAKYMKKYTEMTKKMDDIESMDLNDAENLYMASRNLENTLVLLANEINVYDILNADIVVVDTAAMKYIEEVLK